jgi:hypothetical protein
MKAIDIGINFMTGYLLTEGVQFSFNYNAGLSNLYPGTITDGTLKSHYFGFRLGYLLK